MGDQTSFATRVRERYPEGLTGVLAVGSTRTMYILEQNRQHDDPGGISDFTAYATFMLARMLEFIKTFFELGGQNVIIPLLSYQGFDARGPEYAASTTELCHELLTEKFIAFYHDNDCDPYFTGIDTLLHLSHDEPAYNLGAACDAFNKQWEYHEGRRKIIWEVAPIPLYSFLKAPIVMGADAQATLEAKLAAATDLRTMYKLLYQYYTRAVYGTDLPIPHFYLGASRNGDLKLRSMLPIALLCGDPFRLFYTPYPSLYITRDTLQAILEDLAFGKPLRSTNKDYSGQYTSELLDAEYQRVLDLKDDPSSTIGLMRHIPLKRDS